MDTKTLLADVDSDVYDIFGTEFQYAKTLYVPSADDQDLSHDRAAIKKGKELETCVLYVDIRGSVAMTRTVGAQDMGKIYTAFVKSVIKAGRDNGGHTRNIIGDRVMIVFPVKDCFTNAVRCAISINHIASKLIAPKLRGLEFKCGIGIDHGLMKIIKVGVPRRLTKEKETNRSLVWAGEPANLASRLTDSANKTIKQVYYDMVRQPFNFYDHNVLYGGLSLPDFMYKPNPKAPMYLNEEKVEKSEQDFLDGIHMIQGQVFWHSDKVSHFEKKNRDISYKPILISERVLIGLKAEGIDAHLSQTNFWHEQPKVKDVDVKVFGANLNWGA